ncbi:Aminopeptidase Ey, partial [Geodia barretti]
PHYAHTVDPRVDADLKSVVYPVGIAYGGEEEWEFVWDQYLSSSDPYEKRLFLSALGKSRIPWLLSRYLEYSIDPSKVRTQDTTTVIAYVSANVYGRYLTWNFVRNNSSLFLERHGGGSFSFSRLIKYVTGSFTTELELKEVERFFSEQGTKGVGLGLSDRPWSAGLLDTQVALNLSQYIRDETEYVPCLTGLSQLTSLGNRLSLTPVYGLFQEFVRNLTSDFAKICTFNRTTSPTYRCEDSTFFMRTLVLNTAWANGNDDVIDTATQLFQNWMRFNQT